MCFSVMQKEKKTFFFFPPVIGKESHVAPLRETLKNAMIR